MYLIFSGSGTIVDDMYTVQSSFRFALCGNLPSADRYQGVAHDMSVALVEPSVYLQSLLPIPRSPLQRPPFPPTLKRTILPSSILPSSQTLPSPPSHLQIKSPPPQNQTRSEALPANYDANQTWIPRPRPPYWSPAPLNPRHGSSPDFTTQLCIHWH